MNVRGVLVTVTPVNNIGGQWRAKRVGLRDDGQWTSGIGVMQGRFEGRDMGVAGKARGTSMLRESADVVGDAGLMRGCGLGVMLW